MLNLLYKIPAKNHAAIIGSMQGAASFGALMGLLCVMGFSEATEEKCSGALLWKDCKDIAVPISERLTYLAAGIGLLLFALVSVIAAVKLMGVRGRLKKYVAILTGIESMGIAQVASIVRSNQDAVRSEIELAIEADMLEDIYVDYGRNMVISTKYLPKTSHKTVVVCHRCQAHNELIVGITKACNYCREPLLL